VLLILRPLATSRTKGYQGQSPWLVSVIAAEKLGKTPQHVDDSSAQQLYARHVYSWRDIRWQHGYRNITSVSPVTEYSSM
jgi:hypothetical protein